MLAVSAGQVGDPVAVLILMEADDRLLHECGFVRRRTSSTMGTTPTHPESWYEHLRCVASGILFVISQARLFKISASALTEEIMSTATRE
jgi:hypothetical protein